MRWADISAVVDLGTWALAGRLDLHVGAFKPSTNLWLKPPVCGDTRQEGWGVGLQYWKAPAGM